MRVFVTGSTGMVGRNLVEVLSSRGYEVIVSRSTEVDLTNYPATLAFVRKTAPDLIIHAAGKVGGIQANSRDPFGFFLSNMQMGMNVVQASKEAGVGYLLNLSSSCSYPCALTRPLTEADVFAGMLEPTNEGYAIAKAATLRLCAFAARQFPGCHFKTIVPCNLYGRYDKFGKENAHMIPSVIRKLHEAVRNGVECVSIWGDGTARREFMYVGDLAEMIEQYLRRFDEMPEIMNIGLGFDFTVNEYYAAIAKVVGYQGQFEHDLTRPVGMKRKLLDVSLQTALGLRARYSLEQGLEETYAYYLSSEWSKT